MKKIVAAVQFQGRVGDLKYNLEHAKELMDEAIHQGAEVIALPEFYTTPIVLDRRVWGCALPPENIALDLLKEYAIEKNVLIGGSYLEKRKGDVFNCYTLVQPDGTVTRHDKDIPTMVENAFYIGGDTTGVHRTADYGNVGTAVCWETIRMQTVNRLKDRVDFLMTGSHWWTVPKDWHLPEFFVKESDQWNRDLMAETPSRLSKLLGVANIHSAYCGALPGTWPILPKRLFDAPYDTELLGETQIVDNEGNIVQRMGPDEGPGVITAKIDLTVKEPVIDERPDQYWIPKMKKRALMYWWHQNFISKGIYTYAKARRLF